MFEEEAVASASRQHLKAARKPAHAMADAAAAAATAAWCHCRLPAATVCCWASVAAEASPHYFIAASHPSLSQISASVLKPHRSNSTHVYPCHTLLYNPMPEPSKTHILTTHLCASFAMLLHAAGMLPVKLFPPKNRYSRLASSAHSGGAPPASLLPFRNSFLSFRRSLHSIGSSPVSAFMSNLISCRLRMLPRTWGVSRRAHCHSSKGPVAGTGCAAGQSRPASQ